MGNARGFAIGIKQWGDGLEGEAAKREAEVVKDLAGGLRRRTPRETGQAQHGWVATVGSPSDFVPPEAPFLPPDNGRDDLSGLKFGDTAYVTNNAPHIQPLNRGHSQQAPPRFVEAELARVARKR